MVSYTGDITLGSGVSGDFGHNLTLGATNGGEVDFAGKILANNGSAHSTVTVSNLSGAGSATVKVLNSNTYLGGTVVNPNVTYAVGLQSGANTPLGSGAVTLNGGRLALQGQTAHGTQQAIGATGYNTSLIVPNDAPEADQATTGTIDGSSVFYQEGYTNLFGVTGAHGLNDSGLYTSQYNPSVQFQLQPYHQSTSLTLKAGAATTAGTLTLNSPTAYSSINLLSDSGNIFPTVQVTFNFDDSTTETQTIQVQNWFFNGSQTRLAIGGSAPSTIIGAIQRTTNPATNDTFQDNFFGSMYENDLTLSPANQSKQLDSITLAVTNFNGGTNGVNFFAVSGSTYVPPATQGTQSFANDVVLSADSTIDVSGSLAATMGNLTTNFNMLSATSSDTSSNPYSLSFSGATVIGNSGINVANSAGGGAGTVILGAVTDQTGSLTKTGAGKLVLSGGATLTGALKINGGSVEVDGATTVGSLGGDGTGSLSVVSANMAVAAHAAGHDSAAALAGLSITGNGRLDLANNDLIIGYTGASPASTIRGYLASAYNGGAWEGNGLASTSAGQGGGGLTALGYGDAADLGITSVDGIAVTGNAVIVKYTYYGDSDLDGKIDLGNDFALFLIGFLTPGSNAWDLGDYNYDGHVDMADFGMFIDGYASQGGSLGQLDSVILAAPLTANQKAELLSVVPEPASVGMLAIRRGRGNTAAPGGASNL